MISLSVKEEAQMYEVLTSQHQTPHEQLIQNPNFNFFTCSKKKGLVFALKFPVKPGATNISLVLFVLAENPLVRLIKLWRFTSS